MLVVEGCDGTGKTHLVKRLSEDLKLPIVPKAVASDMSSLVPSLKGWVEEHVDRPVRGIYDRHRLISEPIYGTIMRGSLEDGFDDLLWLTRQWARFENQRPCVVICSPPPLTVLTNIFHDENQPPQVVVEYSRLYWSYHALLAHHSEWLHWDYVNDQDRYDRLLDRIKAKLAVQRSFVQPRLFEEAQ